MMTTRGCLGNGLYQYKLRAPEYAKRRSLKCFAGYLCHPTYNGYKARLDGCRVVGVLVAAVNGVFTVFFGAATMAAAVSAVTDTCLVWKDEYSRSTERRRSRNLPGRRQAIHSLLGSWAELYLIGVHTSFSPTTFLFVVAE